jgi:hypothetical protein
LRRSRRRSDVDLGGYLKYYLKYYFKYSIYTGAAMEIPKGGRGRKEPYTCRSVDIVEDILLTIKAVNTEAKTLLIEGRVNELEALKEKIEDILQSSGTFGRIQK